MTLSCLLIAMPCVDANAMDIKRSTYKTVKVFLKACAKDGLVKLKETKGDVVVTGTSKIYPLSRSLTKSTVVQECRLSILPLLATHHIVRSTASRCSVKEPRRVSARRRKTRRNGRRRFTLRSYGNHTDPHLASSLPQNLSVSASFLAFAGFVILTPFF